MKLLTSVLTALAALVFCLPVFSQEKTVSVSGTIQEYETKKPVTGVSISDGNKIIGVNTTSGGFTLKVPIGTKLHFISVSYAEETIVADKNISGLVIYLKPSAKELEAVTVTTALGISRKQKSLGYSVQSLNADDINEAHANNWISSLSGKIAGLNLLSSGSGPLNSTRVSLRGDVSLNADNNNALIVVDGVPKSSGLTTAGVNNAYGAGSGNDVPVDFGNGIADINPDDIESITVLKGPGATALYGSRAANGAILITTKSGANKKDNGLGITFNSNTSINAVLRWPDYQYEYGQGTGKALNSAGQFYYSYGASPDGASTSGTSSAFGPRFEGQSYFQYDPVKQGQGAERTPWVPYKDNIKKFWQTGFTTTNNIAIEGGNEKGSARASVTHTKNEWIMPNTGFERLTAAISLNYKVSDRLKLVSKVSYTNKNSDNLPATGYNNQSIAYFMIFQNPNVNLDWYKDRWKRGYEQIDQIHPYSSFIDNPFLIAHEMTNAVNNNNIVGTLAATYTVSKKLELMVRSGIDMTNEERAMKRPFSTANFVKGYYKEQNIADMESNTDVLVSYKDRIGKYIEVSASAGANTMKRNYNRVDAYVDGLVIPAEYKLSNGSGLAITTDYDRNKVVNSVYGFASFGYKSKYFVDITGRNDWSSTLPVQHNAFFYPSINTSFVLSEIFRLPAVISFAKLRASIAQVGNDTDPYKTHKYYGTSEFAGSGSVPTTMPNASFKPEISTSYETGLDIRFFKNRLNLDVTLYHNLTRNQILEVPLDPTTGYTRAVLNAGVVRNRGMEIVLNAVPVKQANFQWSTTLNWSKNQNRIMELAEGMTDKQDIGYGGNATLQARVGGTTGDIYGFGFLRAPDGQIVYTAAGLPARPSEIQFIGNAYADWKGGWQNEFSYKNIRFSFLFEGQMGGLIYSQTHHKMSEQGKLQHTLRGRAENYIIGEGVVLDANGKYVPNTKKVLPVDYYADYYRRANVEANSFDASFLKLREARIEYNFSKRIIGNSFIKKASVALYGRDLLLITKFPIFDPETAALNGSTLLPGIEMGQLPSTRTMGINLTLKF